MRLGRQEFILHEHRLIGNVGWLQQARAFNGARAWTGNDQMSAEVAIAQTATPRSALYEGGSMLGYARVGLAEAGKLDAVYILDASEDRERSLSTAGVYARGSSGILSGRAEAYYQFGRTDGLDVQAFLAGAYGTIAPEAAMKPKLTLWYDYMSGNDADNADTKGAFDTLYATNHKFYGLTDIPWFIVGGAADGRGLQDAALKIAASPADNVSVKLDGHVFLAANGDGYLGAEPDLTVSWKAAKGIAFATGAGVFLPEEGTMETWGFLQVNAAL